MKRLFQCALSLAFVAVLATGCDDPTSTQLDIDAQFARGGNGVVAMATGSRVRAGSIRHFQFSAIEKANGSVSGQFNLTFEGPGNTHVHGEIVCIASTEAGPGSAIRSRARATPCSSETRAASTSKTMARDRGQLIA